MRNWFDMLFENLLGLESSRFAESSPNFQQNGAEVGLFKLYLVVQLMLQTFCREESSFYGSNLLAQANLGLFECSFWTGSG